MNWRWTLQAATGRDKIGFRCLSVVVPAGEWRRTDGPCDEALGGGGYGLNVSDLGVSLRFTTVFRLKVTT